MPPLVKKKKKAPLTFEQRYTKANAKVGRALDVFEEAVNGLDQAANEHDDLGVELDTQIEEMQALRSATRLQSENTRTVADNLRGLVSPQQ